MGEGAESQQSGQQGGNAQGGTAGGDIKNMNVGDLIDLANQQNIDLSALNDLLGQVQINPDVNVGGSEATPQ